MLITLCGLLSIRCSVTPPIGARCSTWCTAVWWCRCVSVSVPVEEDIIVGHSQALSVCFYFVPKTLFLPSMDNAAVTSCLSVCHQTKSQIPVRPEPFGPFSISIKALSTCDIALSDRWPGPRGVGGQSQHSKTGLVPKLQGAEMSWCVIS